MSLSRALEQMERGFGAGSTPASRADVNAETMQARAERDLELRIRRAVKIWTPVRASSGDLGERLQSGELGRLD